MKQERNPAMPSDSSFSWSSLAQEMAPTWLLKGLQGSIRWPEPFLQGLLVTAMCLGLRGHSKWIKPKDTRTEYPETTTPSRDYCRRLQATRRQGSSHGCHVINLFSLLITMSSYFAYGGE